jgi:hypothetical protein
VAVTELEKMVPSSAARRHFATFHHYRQDVPKRKRNERFGVFGRASRILLMVFSGEP